MQLQRSGEVVESPFYRTRFSLKAWILSFLFQSRLTGGCLAKRLNHVQHLSSWNRLNWPAFTAIQVKSKKKESERVKGKVEVWEGKALQWKEEALQCVFVWSPSHFASSPSNISSFGSRKCRFVETSRLGHKRTRKGNRSPCEMRVCEKKPSMEMCHSACVRKPFIQRSMCAADCVRAGGDVLWWCFFLYAVVAFCMRLPSPSAWEAMIHCTWLTPLSVSSIHRGYKLLNCTSHTLASPDCTHGAVLQLGVVKTHTCIAALKRGSDRHISFFWAATVNSDVMWGRVIQVSTISSATLEKNKSYYEATGLPQSTNNDPATLWNNGTSTCGLLPRQF